MGVATSGEQQYMAGYNAGRTSALTTGSVDAGRRWLAEQRGTDSAYIAGSKWALWDHEDASGLSHNRDADTAMG